MFNRLHIYVSMGLLVLFAVLTGDIYIAIVVTFGVGFLKEAIDLLTSKLPEVWKKRIRRLKIFSCTGWSWHDIGLDAFGIMLGIFIYATLVFTNIISI